MSTMPTVLFLCPHNALRSVIAAALLNHLSDGRARGESAGTEPDDRVNDRAITVLREIGIEVADEKPGRVTAEQIECADRVVNLDCPLPPALDAAASRKIERWPMPDTSGKPVEAVREVRDLIQARVEQLLAELAAARHGAS